MDRPNDHELRAFLAIARESSFTRAAAALRVSQSALSYSMRQLESRLGVRLLTRTTRSVALTQAGERLYLGIGPRFAEIDAEIQALGELHDRPTGNIRISATDYAIRHTLWPRLSRFLPHHPGIRVEMINDYAMADIVTERYDAGVRFGDVVAKDMISVRIGPDVRFAVVGAPGYFQDRPAPETPQDLLQHNCINLRLPTLGGIYSWEFEEEGREVKVRTEGQLVFNSTFPALRAAIDGAGLAHMPEDIALPHIKAGRLVRVLEKWCPYWPGYHLYYPNRRQPTAAFTLLVDALRWRRDRFASQAIVPEETGEDAVR